VVTSFRIPKESDRGSSRAALRAAARLMLL
jgi:hypothetical protein